MRWVQAAALFGLAIAPTARPDAPPEALALSACRAIAEPSSRLQCLDRAAAALDEAQASGAIAIVRRGDARASSMLAPAPDRGRPASGPAPSVPTVDDVLDRPASIHVKVVGAHATASGRWVMVAADGERFRQTDERQDVQVRPGADLLVQRRGGRLLCAVDGARAFSCIYDGRAKRRE